MGADNRKSDNTLNWLCGSRWLTVLAKGNRVNCVGIVIAEFAAHADCAGVPDEFINHASDLSREPPAIPPATKPLNVSRQLILAPFQFRLAPVMAHSWSA
jgi:hypothetical protein